MSFQILGTGSFAPEKVLTNEDLSHMVETSDEWITKRVGVKQRHVCTTETATDMGVEAAQRALENSGVKPEELDMIIAATISADTISPGLAGMVQNRLGAGSCPCFDINVACPGFLYALDVADGFFARGRVKKVLVVSSERMSGLIDWADRSTCVIFGDGAGAAVLGEGDGYLSSVLTTKGGEDVISIPTKWDNSPFYENPLKKNVVNNEARRRLPEIAPEKFLINIDRYGNTSSASEPILLDEANRQGLLQRGDYVVLTAFGGGLSTAACVVRW